MKSSDKGLFPSDTRRLGEERPSLREPLVVAHSPHPSTDKKKCQTLAEYEQSFLLGISHTHANVSVR